MPFKDSELRRAKAREYSRLWARKRWVTRRAHKLCIGCGCPVEKFRMCIRCRRKRQAQYEAVERPRRMARAKACEGCGARCVKAGARRCGSCTAKRANAIRWARRRDEAAA